MRPSDTPELISAARLRALASAYASHVPSPQRELNSFRVTELPTALASRCAGAASQSESTDSAKGARLRPHITRAELSRLMAWKLRRGTFRPKLQQMIDQLPEPSVVDVSTRAFAVYDEGRAAAERGESASSGGESKAKKDKGTASTRDEELAEGAKKAIQVLRELKGVGPATASLVLSVYDVFEVPFFSDELFIWLSTKTPADTKSGDRTLEVAPPKVKIGYTAPEYQLLMRRLHELKKRLEHKDAKSNEGILKAMDVEHAAWLIVKGLANSNSVEEVGQKPPAQDNKSKDQKKRQASTTTAGTAPSKKKAKKTA